MAPAKSIPVASSTPEVPVADDGLYQSMEADAAPELPELVEDEDGEQEDKFE